MCRKCMYLLTLAHYIEAAAQNIINYLAHVSDAGVTAVICVCEGPAALLSDDVATVIDVGFNLNCHIHPRCNIWNQWNICFTYEQLMEHLLYLRMSNSWNIYFTLSMQQPICSLL
jgi:hypothetical protein